MHIHTFAAVVMIFLLSCKGSKNDLGKSEWRAWQNGYEVIKIDSVNLLIRDLDDNGNVRSISIINEKNSHGVQIIYLNGAMKYVGQSGYKVNKFIDLDSLKGNFTKLVIF